MTALHVGIYEDYDPLVDERDYAEDVAAELNELIQSDACVDRYHCDQLLLYMALAKGTSQIRTTTNLSNTTK